MTRRFSVRPVLTLRGRTFNGLRGWSGKPTHPPLTDIPIAAYILGATFDVIATLGRHHDWSRDFFRAGTFVVIGGVAVSMLTALTGYLDWSRSTEKGTQARRTANTHACTMILVTVLATVDVVLRLGSFGSRSHPTASILVLSVVTAALVAVGATFGGSLVFEHGLQVEVRVLEVLHRIAQQIGDRVHGVLRSVSNGVGHDGCLQGLSPRGGSWHTQRLSD